MFNVEIRKKENIVTSLLEDRKDVVNLLNQYREELCYRDSRRTENLVEELEFDLEELDSKIEELIEEIENS
jgi:hypothetical protein